MTPSKRRTPKPHRPGDIYAVAAKRRDRIVPAWPEKGTGRTAPLATCGHCGGKPLIIRRCGIVGNVHRYCAVCEKCGAHRQVQAAAGSVANCPI